MIPLIKKPEQPAATESDVSTPSPQDQQNFLEAIANYKQYGKAIKRATTMQEVGGKLAHIAELAEVAVVNEADDWYDAHTLKRNMKEIKTYAAEFGKLAKEADLINQRMHALYEDMGRVLDRYFELPDDEMEDGSSDAATPSRDIAPVSEGVHEDQLLQNPSEPPLEDQTNVGKAAQNDKGLNDDEMTLRAIKAVYARLLQKNPDLAKKFTKLNPKVMKKIVWKLVGE